MRKKFVIHKLEIGQVIPLVVLMMFVIIGFVALILDGGAVMSNRRTAQAAADAGALAGAKRICTNNPDAIAVAEHYATTINGATFAQATVQDNQITVATTVEGPSFFAKIFGEDSLRAATEAAAGCYYPNKTNRFLPIAFYYQTPPINASDANCIDQPCNLVNYDFTELMEELDNTDPKDQPIKNIYVVSDNTKVCDQKVTGEIVCNNATPDESGGNRTWLDLKGVDQQIANIRKAIKGGFDLALEFPAWVQAQPGVINAGYDKNLYEFLDPIPGYEHLDFRLVAIPVYDRYCAKNPRNNCADPGDNFYMKNENAKGYRLVGLAPFVVTCVTRNQKCEFGECTTSSGGQGQGNNSICPGYEEAFPLPRTGQQKDAIEGYFVNGVPADKFTWGTDGIDVGIYLISLSK